MREISRVLVVDLPHSFWSVALGGGLQNSNAAKEIVLREIRGLAADYDRVAIATDVRGRSFRAELWDPVADAEQPKLSRYKAGRSEREERLWTLLDDVTKACVAAGWHVFVPPEHPEFPGCYFEGDDVAATLAVYAAHELQASVDILSGDSDLAQLVDDSAGVRLLRRYKGIHPLDENGVQDWLKVPAFAVSELKALGGDSGDKYKPFPGIGDVTAIAMLAAAGWSAATALNATAAAEKSKRPAIQAMVKRVGPERLALAYQLARVCANVPLDCDRLLEKREPIAVADLGADLLPDVDEPDDLPEVAGEPVAPAAPVVPATSGTALAKVDPTARMLISPNEARNRLVELRAMVRSILTPNVDYGTIPGCGDKRALMKSGAEKLGEVYGYAPEFEVQKEIERWEDPPLFYYRIKATLRRKIDGVAVAECIGSANSRETKWAARWAFERDVPGHLDLSRLRKREFTYSKGERAGDKFFKYQVPNEEIFDQVNTILKMAEKRAFVGAVLLACRASGIFAADTGDVSDRAYGEAAPRPQWDA